MQIVSLSVPQKITALAIFIGIVAIIVFVFSAEPHSAVSSYRSLPQAAASTPVPAVAEANLNSERPTSVSPSVQVQPEAQSAQAANPKKADAWILGNAKSVSPLIPLSKAIRDYEVIEINQHPETTPQVGETVSLPLLNGQKILVDVQATTLNPNGDKSWSGHLQGYGEDYPIIMTYGEHAIFATITTPEGSYTMESTDGVGWLYKNPSEFELSDASAKDFLEIPHAL